MLTVAGIFRRMRYPSKWGDWSMLAASLCCLALIAVRWVAVFSYDPAVTTGQEDESLFALWQFVNGQPIYVSPFAPPFASSLFNWVFYQVYGRFDLLVLSALKLSQEEIPTISRALTLGLSVLLAGVCYCLLDSVPRLRRLAGAMAIAFSPLAGFWTITARPDLSALLTDLIGIWCVRQWERSRASVWVMFAALSFYCTWGFKQSAVGGLAGACFYLFSKNKKQAALLAMTCGLGFGLTLFLGSPEYRYDTLGAQVSMGYSVPLAVHNTAYALFKQPLFALGLGFVLWSLLRRRMTIFAWVAVVSTPLMAIAAGKTGASDNYLLEAAATSAIVFLTECSTTSLVAGAGLLTVPVAMISFGLAGMVFPIPTPELQLLRQNLEKWPSPVVVTERYGNLPWSQRRFPHFVYSAAYEYDRALGKPFKFDGIAGMIRSGMIRTVVWPRNKLGEPFDGISSGSLRKIGEDGHWAYFSTTLPSAK